MCCEVYIVQLRMPYGHVAIGFGAMPVLLRNATRDEATTCSEATSFIEATTIREVHTSGEAAWNVDRL
jgi:hypothetical protein